MGATPTRRAGGRAEPARRGPSASRRRTPQGTQYLFSSDAFPGRVYKLTLDGKVARLARQVGAPGRSSSVGFTRSRARRENEIYVAELLNWRVQKLVAQAGGRQDFHGRVSRSSWIGSEGRWAGQEACSRIPPTHRPTRPVSPAKLAAGPSTRRPPVPARTRSASPDRSRRRS